MEVPGDDDDLWMDDMAENATQALGLSVGATNLAAVIADRAVTSTPVLTLYPDCPPEVGVSAEKPQLADPGLVIADFVDRVGGPGGVVASDGSTHRPETLLADGLRAIAATATVGLSTPGAVAVTYPAHWPDVAVDALRDALGQVPEWSPMAPPTALIADSEAALIALHAYSGVPTRGIVAVCDFGGSGTSITLVDTANGDQPIGDTVRCTSFSGELVDQALLNYVVADLSMAGSFGVAGAPMVGSLDELRAECRGAKERISTSTVTALNVDLPGFLDDILLTRSEVSDAIRQPLDSFMGVLREVLDRRLSRHADLVAIAAVGGEANIPAITTALSEQFRVPVLIAPHPHLTASIGAALRAAQSSAEDSETPLTQAGVPDGQTPLEEPAAEDSETQATQARVSDGEPAAETVTLASPAQSRTFDPAAWWESDNAFEAAPVPAGADPWAADSAAQTSFFDEPQLDFEQDTSPGDTKRAHAPWYRGPTGVLVAAALPILVIGVVATILLRHLAGGAGPASTPSVTTTPAPTPVAPSTRPAPEPVAPPWETRSPTELPPRPVLPPFPEPPTFTPPPPPPERPSYTRRPPPSEPPPSEPPPPSDSSPSSEPPPFPEFPFPQLPQGILPIP